MATKPDIYSELYVQHPATCVFAELIPAFQELFDPEPARLTALMGRLKNVLRLGAAECGRTTKGKAARFRLNDVWELAVVMELCHIGITPAKAIEIYRETPNLMVSHITLGNGSVLRLDIPAIGTVLERRLPWMFDGAAA